MAELWQLSISEASELLRRREISAVELTRAHVERIDQIEGSVRAFVTVTERDAMREAEQVDQLRREGAELGPLAGIPIAIKDVISTKGVRTTCSSRMLEHYTPIYDATVMNRLHDARAIMLGKTNMDEFAMGSSTENSAFFPTRNPWDLERVPGGSSGGSAASVAAGEAMASLGSDTGGSVRQPGALTNTVALKPTYGRVSRFGLIAFASSLDQIGPFTRSARDMALMMQAIAGYDRLDSTSINAPVPNYSEALTGDVKGLRIGVPSEYFVEGTEPGVRAVVEQAIETLKSLGAVVEECSLPHTRYGVAAYYIIAPAECSANLARYDGVKYGFSSKHVEGSLIDYMSETRAEGFGPEVKRRIMLGAYALSSGYYDAYYLKAEKVRTLIKRDFDAVFDRFDAIIGPTSPSVAFKIGEKISDPYAMYLNDVFTIPANLAGICGLSMPGGFSEGLPVGVQLLGPALGEPMLLRIADAFEQATDYHRLMAPTPVKRKRGSSR
ncbi:MAG TPA: Asp-tRNA(Asn)/Glu-tRNA(Gln) amidotransferase subunit GatA [Ktedonobacterales bacterium]|nr:Asp-tRNA(Asn)/Glu-tRNA(Gln) amidotransferase subunit GatA [Ktedonobacterales bacterium]